MPYFKLGSKEKLLEGRCRLTTAIAFSSTSVIAPPFLKLLEVCVLKRHQIGRIFASELHQLMPYTVLGLIYPNLVQGHGLKLEKSLNSFSSSRIVFERARGLTYE